MWSAALFDTALVNSAVFLIHDIILADLFGNTCFFSLIWG